MSLRVCAVVMSMLFAVLAFAPAAHARQFETVMQDDALLLHRSDEQTMSELVRMKNLGVDRVRVTAVWKEIAPAGDQTVRPAGFDAADHLAYEQDRWRHLDRIVRFASTVGVKVMIDIGFYAPLWASGDDAGSDRGVTRVSTSELGAFAHAVAVRYSGSATDVQRRPIPAVDVFTIWNEPNHPGFVQPQWQGTRPASADWYRAAVKAAYPQIKTAAPTSTVLIGATTSGGDDTGQGRRSVSPTTFLRRLACVDRKLRPVRDGSCASFDRVPGDGFSHHPYGLSQLPGQKSRTAGHVTMADLPAFSKLIGRLAARGRLASGVRNLWLTEYGYETNEQVSAKQFSPEQQSQFLAWAEHIAFGVAAVRAYPQFLLRDIETQAAIDLADSGSVRRAPGSWQSGLFQEGGQAKPAAFSFAYTLDVSAAKAKRGRTGREVRFFGHIRPLHQVTQARIEMTADGGQTAELVGTRSLAGDAAGEFATDENAMFRRVRRMGSLTGKRFRVSFQDAAGAWQSGPWMLPHTR